MQLQLQHKFEMVKKLKVEPEETFMCLCYHGGKIIAGTREGSLVVIDCKVRSPMRCAPKVDKKKKMRPIDFVDC